MTNEEAIRILREESIGAGAEKMPELRQAYSMAIDALNAGLGDGSILSGAKLTEAVQKLDRTMRGVITDMINGHHDEAKVNLNFKITYDEEPILDRDTGVLLEGGDFDFSYKVVRSISIKSSSEGEPEGKTTFRMVGERLKIENGGQLHFE